MDQDIQQKLAEQEQKLDAIYASVEKTRKYFLVILWVTVLAIILPLIGLIFVIPTVIGNYTAGFEGLL